jgi:phosphatidate cytidylyltransferase
VGTPILRRVEDLGPRVLSAMALIPLALGAAVAGGPWLAGAAGAAVVAMAWEWASISEPNATTPAFRFALAGALGAVMLAGAHQTEAALAWAVAAGVASAIRRKGATQMLETAGGVAYIAVPCVAFLWIRAQPIGLVATIGLFMVIWSADAAAYFTGRFVGGPKLMPSLSGQKTVSGLFGALAAGTAAAWVYGAILGADRAAWSLCGLIIAGVGMGGDLFESMLKRRFGVKDASQLIPGHGGVLDRIDGLMAASVLAAAVLKFSPSVVARLAP